VNEEQEALLGCLLVIGIVLSVLGVLVSMGLR